MNSAISHDINTEMITTYLTDISSGEYSRLADIQIKHDTLVVFVRLFIYLFTYNCH